MDLIRLSLRGMYRLRHQVFNERLHWDVQDFGELEIDQFDYQNPNYILANSGEKVIACWRLIPTSENYMLEEVFDFMLGNQPLPKDEKIWELSRFAVIDAKPVGCALSEATVFMIREIMDFALKKKITGYLAVTSVGVERLMKSVGIPMERVGNKKAVMIGNVKSVLCLTPVNQLFINSTYRLVNEYAYLGMVA